MGQRGATPLPTELGLAGCKGTVQGLEEAQRCCSEDKDRKKRYTHLEKWSCLPSLDAFILLWTQPKLGRGLIRTTGFWGKCL